MDPRGESNHLAKSATSASQCSELLGQSGSVATRDAFDAGNIHLLNWNIEKGKRQGWEADLNKLGQQAQLVLMQEATLSPAMIDARRMAGYWSFAPGYRDTVQATGVLTLSSIEPLTHCNLTAWEPWLRTPKATSITEYLLANRQDTLVVVNIHSINFTLGVKDYRRQLQQVRVALREHTGPIILSGDFNSWRILRQIQLGELVEELRLTTLDYGDDHRVQVFGYPIDHIYVRGLRASNTAATVVSSSDHNPISVSLEFGEHAE
jgi:endonuclease/exonuclease/phosphatase (EEP) superfamily protein YafD